uniref:Uncharacterized protein n=1 Tax=Tanacetum cinerariifolium TaxID=118510 RepID=A0A6L2MI70_TANCI|nr:hypothetical protein [Tanacetum cinerariifolium]
MDLLRHSIGSSAGRNFGTTRPESSSGNTLEMSRFVVVEKIVYYTVIDDCCRLEHGLHVALDMRKTDQSLSCAYFGSENRLLILNKDNYVPWYSRLLRYAKSKPNEKLLYNFIMHGPYVRRMIFEPGDTIREVRVAETYHKQTEELIKKDINQIEADDQVNQTVPILHQRY